MIAFTFAFIAGRYHATPWGRHANEADVAWPPEPVRILRALIATWCHKIDHERFSKAALDDLIDALAQELPVFRLPDAVHAHLRSFMPAPTVKKLIFDGFLRLGENAEMIVAWPGVTLTADQPALAADLMKHLGYLGRAESWVEGQIAESWDGKANAWPQLQHKESASDLEVAELMAPLTPAAWVELRTRLLARRAGLATSRRAALEMTLPERLSDALALDTSDWQRVGWSSPPPLTKIVYARPPIGPCPPVRPRRTHHRAALPERAEVARFLVAGRPRPRIEHALRVGEVARWALMAGGGDPPAEFSGRNQAGPLRDDPAHAHAFFLPEDADGDGLIDHLIVYCRRGFSAEGRRRLDRLHRLWLARASAEWRVALEDIAAPEAFTASALLRSSRTWTSVTPYLMPWHAKPDFGLVQQVRREVELRRVFPRLLSVTVLGRTIHAKRALSFERSRSRSGLSQPDRLGSALSVTFAEAIPGPLALGFACHYGLGLFAGVHAELGPMERQLGCASRP